MKHYGIIGKPVGHSWSGNYFNDKFVREGIEAEYKLYEAQRIEDVPALLNQLDGCNITIPYKQAVIPYLTAIDPVAQEIGAVNVVDKQGKGWNTDWIGFTDSLRPLLQPQDTQALVLGTGGAARAVLYALKQLGIQTTVISRTQTKDTITYNQLTEDMVRSHTIIVNCTPLGMSPHTDEYPDIPYSAVCSAHLLYDCIYNPEQTLFLQKGLAQGARIKNGLEMLHKQAEEAWKVFRMMD